MRSRWGSSSFHSPEWWPEGEQWPPAPSRGQTTWSGFGRAMARRALLLVVVVMFVPVLIGIVIGLGLGSSETGWLTVGAQVVAVVAGALLVGVIAGWFFFRSWRPVRNLIAAAGRLADGDYTARVPVARPASLRPVTNSFNEMAVQLETAQQQRRRLLADVGHELRTPLTVIRGEIEAMLDGVHPPDAAHLRPLLDDVGVMERLIDDLRTLSLAEAGALALHREPTDLVGLVGEAADALRREAAKHGVTIQVVTHAGSAAVSLDPVRMREVLTNLMVNGIRAMPDGGELSVDLAENGEAVTISVTDTGIGIPADAQERVFDRFQKGIGSSGTGLGLTISRDLVTAHGGRLELISSTPAGTTMRLTIPSATV